MRPNNSIHAEVKLLNSLPKTRKKKIINILVVQIKADGFGNSKPCRNCIIAMNKLARKRNYQIYKIFYSNQCGLIIESSLDKLVAEI